jgi:transitional endoplasmic reticulum ATPase
MLKNTQTTAIPTSSKNPTIQALLEALSPDARAEADSKDWLTRDISIKREGSKIVLPNDPREMTYDVAIETIERIRDEENQIRSVSEVFEGYPMDAAVAFTKAMKQVYGYATPVPTMTFFGPQPPQMVTVKTGPKDHETTQVLIGEFKVPNIENNIETGVTPDGRFYCSGHVRKAEEQVLLQLAFYTRQLLKSESIYRGKALTMKVGGGGNLYRGMEPTFIDTDNYKPEELIFRRDVERALDISLFNLIRKTDICRAHGIPLKRGILLAGPYGTGKTMTAGATAKLCVENNWTFIQIDKVQGLKNALEFANLYSPAVVFAEDIDRITETRDENANDLLNTIDGVVQKGSSVITVLTTNHIDKINLAMLRPGRLDAIINVKTPDDEAVERLLRLYGRGLISGNAKLNEISKKLADLEMIPASIREVVERSKSAMILRESATINVDDMLAVYDMMAYHIELMKGPTTKVPSKQEALGIAVENLFKGDMGAGGIPSDMIQSVEQTLDYAHKALQIIVDVQMRVATLGAAADEINKSNGNVLSNLATKEQVNKILKAVNS